MREKKSALKIFQVPRVSGQLSPHNASFVRSVLPSPPTPFTPLPEGPNMGEGEQGEIGRVILKLLVDEHKELTHRSPAEGENI